MRRRIACLLVSNFPLAARCRRDPEISQGTVAVLENKGAASLVIAASPMARKLGIRPGISLSQAQTLAPELISKPRDVAAEQSAQEALLETASGLSPMIENANPGCVFLDLKGVKEEQALAEEMIRAAAAVGFTARAGVAEGRIAAKLAAHLSRGIPQILSEGGDAEFLVPFPLSWLGALPALVDRLSIWGIKNVGALAALPAGEIHRRLGPEGLALHRAAQGIDEKPLLAWRPPSTLTEKVELEWALYEIEPFLAIARSLLDRLIPRLIGSGVACRRVDLCLMLDPKGEEVRPLPLAAPTTEMKTLLELLGLELAARPPAAPVIGVGLQLHPDRARQAQFSLFGPAAHSPDLLAGAIARLSILLGSDRVGSPRAVDGFRPERYALSEYDPPSPPKVSPLLTRHPVAAAIRVIRPMMPIIVQTDGTPPRPISIKTDSGTDPSVSISGRVKVASGPWRLEEGWWSEEAVARDYWDLELTDSGVYRIFKDLKTNAWFADGIYD